MAIDHKFSNTGSVSILELLQTNIVFQVPKFQRNYSWNREKVATLWDDIMENFTTYKKTPDCPHDAQYLLGPVVLVKHNRQNEFFVIDGQQRLSTLTMLFCVSRDIIYEYFNSTNDSLPSGIEKINEMIENTNMGCRESWKLSLNDTDHKLFEEIQEYEHQSESQIKRFQDGNRNFKTKSEKFLKENYVFLYNRIKESLIIGFDSDKKYKDIINNMSEEDILKLQKENIKHLNYFLNYVREYNYIVKIMVADDSTAFQIFETLNERGQTLSKSNLIKNHILNQIDKKDSDLQTRLSDRWNRVFDDMIGQGQRDDEFIMESIRSRIPKKYPKISLKNLYKILKSEILDTTKCREFIANIEKDAEFLSVLNDPASYSDTESKDDVYALKALKAKLIRTPLLAAWRKWGFTKDYRTLVKFLVKFFFKFRIVTLAHPGTIEQLVLDVTYMINNNKTLDEVITEIIKHDDHDHFKKLFSKFMEDPSKDVAKYVLQEITLSMGTFGDDVKPIDNLTLEHVLPQKFHDHWFVEDFFTDADEQERGMEEYVSRLGNLTLLKTAVNTKLQNKSFQEKKDKGYKESKLEINLTTVCDKTEWNAIIIGEREEFFKQQADPIWDLNSYLKH